MCCDIHAEEDVGSIRGLGTIKIIEDLEIKKGVASAIWFLEKFFKGYEDPRFILMELHLTSFEVQSPIDKKYDKFAV